MADIEARMARLEMRVAELEAAEQKRLRRENFFLTTVAKAQVFEEVLTAIIGHLASGRKPHPDQRRQVELFLEQATKLMEKQRAAGHPDYAMWEEQIQHLREDGVRDALAPSESRTSAPPRQP